MFEYLEYLGVSAALIGLRLRKHIKARSFVLMGYIALARSYYLCNV